MKLALLRIGAGFALIVTALLTAALTELPRERRHARRPLDIADKLLELARVTAGDLVYDLECGDGTLSVTAARKYGARSVCLDVVPRRIAEAHARARSAHVEHLVTVAQQDWQTVDLSPATVIVLFKTGLWHRSVRGQVTRQARPGTRIVSYARDLGSWSPTATSRLPEDVRRTPPSLLMLWVADGIVRPAYGFECGPALSRCK